MPAVSARRRVARPAPPPLPSSSTASASSTFVVTAKTFAKQFAALYFLRLHALRPHCLHTARTALGPRLSTHSTPHTAADTPAHRQPHTHSSSERGGGVDVEGDAVLLCGRLLDVRSERRCVLVGTLYKEQKLKPSILAEYKQQKQGHAAPTLQATATRRQKEEEGDADGQDGDEAGEVQPQSSRWTEAQLAQHGRWVSDDDVLILEDETGRIQLVHDADAQLSRHALDLLDSDSSSSSSSASVPFEARRLCTGVVVGVLGRQEEEGGGRFRVHRVFLPDMAPQTPLSQLLSPSPLPSLPPLSPPTPRFVLLVSGLSFGCPSVDPLPAQLLQDFATGYVGGEHDVSLSSCISTVIIAGNSLHRFGKKKSKDGLKEVHQLPEYDLDDYRVPCRELDVFLTRLSSSLPSVYLLPGPADPANFTLPQQPLHASMTPSAATFTSFRSTTNPALIHTAQPPAQRPREQAAVAGVSLLVTSGQNVSDLLSNVSGMSPLEVLSSFLTWRHLCPSAPDTLPCYPHQTDDPFILHSTPHVLVAGNQPYYDTAFVRGPHGQQCRLLSLPSFAHTGCAALLDTASPDLSCQPLHFSVHRHKAAAHAYQQQQQQHQPHTAAPPHDTLQH